MRTRILVIAGLAFVLGGLVALLALPGARQKIVPGSLTVGQALVGDAVIAELVRDVRRGVGGGGGVASSCPPLPSGSP